jgi:hypothetical protein
MLPPDLKVRLAGRVGRHVRRTPEEFAHEVGKRVEDVEKLGRLPQLRDKLDVTNARATARILTGLLTLDLRPDEMALAIAAGSYFLDKDDAIPDNAPGGFKDDFMIARAVAWALDQEQLYAPTDAASTQR